MQALCYPNFPMRISSFICALPLVLSACQEGSITKQWLDPDKSFSEFEQPDVPTQQRLLEQGAKDSLEKGHPKRAAQYYKQLIDAASTPEDKKRGYTIAYGDALRRSGEFDDALKVFETVLETHQDHIEALEGKGLSLMALGKTSDAGRAFQQVMQRDSGRWRTLNALAILFVTRDLVPEAMAYYAEALRVSPNNPAILNNVGLSQAAIQNWPRAIRAMEQAVQAASSDHRRKQIELNLALVYGISGDLDKARVTAAKYLEGPALDNNMGLYAYLANNKDLATTYLNQALTGSTIYYERAWKNLEIVNDGKPQ
jgi:Flp pilus assembly protein TadD